MDEIYRRTIWQFYSCCHRRKWMATSSRCFLHQVKRRQLSCFDYAWVHVFKYPVSNNHESVVIYMNEKHKFTACPFSKSSFCVENKFNYQKALAFVSIVIEIFEASVIDNPTSSGDDVVQLVKSKVGTFTLIFWLSFIAWFLNNLARVLPVSFSCRHIKS